MFLKWAIPLKNNVTFYRVPGFLPSEGINSIFISYPVANSIVNLLTLTNYRAKKSPYQAPQILVRILNGTAQ